MPMIFVFKCTENAKNELLTMGFSRYTYFVNIQTDLDIQEWESKIFRMRGETPFQFFAASCFAQKEKKYFASVVMAWEKSTEKRLHELGLEKQMVYVKHAYNEEKIAQEVMLSMEHVPDVWCVSSWWGKGA